MKTSELKADGLYLAQKCLCDLLLKHQSKQKYTIFNLVLKFFR